MASRISAIQRLRPRIQLEKTVQRRDLVEFIARRTGLNEGEIVMVLCELRDAIAYFLRYGQGVKLDGLGTYLPNLQLDGILNVQHRLDKDLKRDLNRDGFRGRLHNPRNIGKTPDQLVAQWNVDHPDDPVS